MSLTFLQCRYYLPLEKDVAFHFIYMYMPSLVEIGKVVLDKKM